MFTLAFIACILDGLSKNLFIFVISFLYFCKVTPNYHHYFHLSLRLRLFYLAFLQNSTVTNFPDWNYYQLCYYLYTFLSQGGATYYHGETLNFHPQAEFPPLPLPEVMINKVHCSSLLVLPWNLNGIMHRKCIIMNVFFLILDSINIGIYNINQLSVQVHSLFSTWNHIYKYHSFSSSTMVLQSMVIRPPTSESLQKIVQYQVSGTTPQSVEFLWWSSGIFSATRQAI